MKALKFLRLRMGNLEVRTCDEHLIGDFPHTTMEIVQWETESCYTIAFWSSDKEGYRLRFVCDRPFKYNVDPVDFMRLAAFGQEELNKFFMEDDDGS